MNTLLVKVSPLLSLLPHPGGTRHGLCSGPASQHHGRRRRSLAAVPTVRGSPPGQALGGWQGVGWGGVEKKHQSALGQAGEGVR